MNALDPCGMVNTLITVPFTLAVASIVPLLFHCSSASGVWCASISRALPSAVVTSCTATVPLSGLAGSARYAGSLSRVSATTPCVHPMEKNGG